MNWNKKYYNPPFLAKIMAMYIIIGVAFWSKSGLNSIKPTAKVTSFASAKQLQFLTPYQKQAPTKAVFALTPKKRAGKQEPIAIVTFSR
jgi:hypothetical protein